MTFDMGAGITMYKNALSERACYEYKYLYSSNKVCVAGSISPTKALVQGFQPTLTLATNTKIFVIETPFHMGVVARA